MAAATKYRDRPHARIYFAWVELPAWREASIAAHNLLVEMLVRYRPGENGRLEWSVRRVAEVLGVSKSTATTALNELETIGWIEVTRVGNFSRKGRSSLYALAMYTNDVIGEPATRAFEKWRPDGSRPLGSRCRVSKQVRTVRSEVQDSLSRDEKLSAPEDTQGRSRRLLPRNGWP
jgi:DNA-binding transcriptional MocR family regulator